MGNEMSGEIKWEKNKKREDNDEGKEGKGSWEDEGNQEWHRRWGKRKGKIEKKGEGLAREGVSEEKWKGGKEIERQRAREGEIWHLQVAFPGGRLQ